jgi:hypothetical protein
VNEKKDGPRLSGRNKTAVFYTNETMQMEDEEDEENEENEEN